MLLRHGIGPWKLDAHATRLDAHEPRAEGFHQSLALETETDVFVHAMTSEDMKISVILSRRSATKDL